MSEVQKPHSDPFLVIDTARFLADHPENAGVSDAIKLARAYVNLFEQIKQCRRERDDFEQRLHDYQTGRL